MVSALSLGVVPPVSATPGDQIWIGPFPGRFHAITAIAVAPDGQTVFVTGWTSPEYYWYEHDYQTIAFDADTGAQRWSMAYSGEGTRDAGDAAFAIAVGPGGNRVYVTGESDGTDTDAGYATIAYRADTGEMVWTSRYEGPKNTADRATAIAVGPGGNRVFVTGLASHWNHADLSYDDESSTTVAYLARSGDRLWTRRFHVGEPLYPERAVVAVGPGGRRVFVARPSHGTGTGRDYNTVAYLAGTGHRLWARTYDGSAGNTDEPSGIVVGPAGRRVYVTGTSVGSGTGEDYATVAYRTNDGAIAWSTRYDGLGLPDEATAIGVSPDGESVFVTGSSKAKATGWDYATIAYVARSGSPLWRKRHDTSSGHDKAFALALARDGTQVFVAGGTGTIAYRPHTGGALWPTVGPAGSVIAVAPDGSSVYIAGVSVIATSTT